MRSKGGYYHAAEVAALQAPVWKRIAKSKDERNSYRRSGKFYEYFSEHTIPLYDAHIDIWVASKETRVNARGFQAIEIKLTNEKILKRKPKNSKRATGKIKETS